jgi:tenascin
MLFIYRGSTGPDCSLEVCSVELQSLNKINCSGHGTCGHKRGDDSSPACHCDDGFTGDDCSQSMCYSCEHGRCTSKGCLCNAGFGGPACDTPVCVVDDTTGAVCHGNGICVSNTCYCESGYLQPHCRQKSCRQNNDCSGHGICNEDGSCACYEGYRGDDCNDPSYTISPIVELCARQVKAKGCGDGAKCSGHGSCNSKLGKCECSSKSWIGDDCSQRPCDSGCSQQGGCAEDGSCACNEGFSGSECEFRDCPNNCSGHGECDTTVGQCTCENRWAQVDCSEKECLKKGGLTCNGHGVCKEGECECIGEYSDESPMWRGEVCDKFVDPPSDDDEEEESRFKKVQAGIKKDVKPGRFEAERDRRALDKEDQQQKVDKPSNGGGRSAVAMVMLLPVILLASILQGTF